VVRPPELRIHSDELVVDSFAGGGGASTGIEWALGRSPDIAINHDPEALAMHRANHPATRHYCEDVWDVDPVEACGGRRVGLAWFSPDCTFHSKARGGKPFRDRNKARRRRGLAWLVVKWAKAVKPRVICLENVEEFEQWGPLTEEGTPDLERRGFTFRRWLASLRGCGYQVEWRQLRACDYGAPTSRKRLFVVARCDGLPIVWPKPTHGRGLVPYRTAADCIDWSIPCPSIFDRTRPLAENTLKRIARGIRRYVFEAASPFIVPVTHTGDSRVAPIDAPMRTITTAKGGELALCAPTLIQTGYGERQGQAPRSLDLQKPLGTVVGGGAKHALVAAFLARHYGGHENDGAPVQMSLPTITTKDHHAIVTSHLLKLRGGLKDHHTTAQALDAPAPTITASGTHLAEVRAFLIAYYGTDQDAQLSLPMATLTTHDRFALVVVQGVEYVIADIGMRMLSPRELFTAQGFDADYQIEIEGLTKTAQVRMCGNSVCPPVASALAGAQFAAQAAEEAA
jgi:DNA (cytosine-5)-methyltransferase 1